MKNQSGDQAEMPRANGFAFPFELGIAVGVALAFAIFYRISANSAASLLEEAAIAIGIWLAAIILAGFFGRTDATSTTLSIESVADDNPDDQQAQEKRERVEDEERGAYFVERAAIEAHFEIEMDKAVAATRDGNIRHRIDTEELDGIYERLGLTLNSLLGRFEHVLDKVGDGLAALTEGHVGSRVEDRFEGDFGILAGNVNNVAGRLHDFAGQLTDSAGRVQNASADVATGSQQLAERSNNQSATINETAMAIDLVARTVKDNAENTQTAHRLTSETADAAATGSKVLGEAVNAMAEIESSAKGIEQMMSLIDEIAAQTNILALNASIEAARAGQAGRGFAVVANEVRTLARRSAETSKDISALIRSSNDHVGNGVRLVQDAGETFAAIVTSLKSVAEIVAEIAQATEDGASRVQQINTAVSEMDEITHSDSQFVSELTESAQTMANQSLNLARIAGFFKLVEEQDLNDTAEDGAWPETRNAI